MYLGINAFALSGRTNDNTIKYPGCRFGTTVRVDRYLSMRTVVQPNKRIAQGKRSDTLGQSMFVSDAL